jgi:hypothetical protein
VSYTLHASSWHLLTRYCAVFSTPSGIFAATGSVGVCLILWLAGKNQRVQFQNWPNRLTSFQAVF